ncbi:hypothetical protein SELMODRAFT_409223 [Selaginella moellendorffii]|uniref:Anaphase-promoting complex subunit 4-like WD40 domain-containing protein n=1 Tax=Selaginella moellendorffii TaxID=88036 RepID=D8RAS2_SELML|nr:SEC12-like protein 2 [Selaginella moellendorffii]EFJ30677.1 hypothetical protein SELMODRAFT_409223 [Selaginella moellendorffii]|eukprot:XP_002968423.1 SEC12-like protein 2 [Selaginella moellendorffii]
MASTSNKARKFGTPLFCAAWASADSTDASVAHGISYAICGGGGGDSSSGLRNTLVLARYDADSRELSEPLDTLFTDDDTACAMAMHPNRKEFICSFPATERHNGKLRLLRLTGGKNLRLENVERELKPLQDLGEQRTVKFSADGKLFAVGGQDGHLKVLKWPSLEVVLDRSDAHRSIKDLDFSLDGSFLAATDDVGPSRIWDLKTASPAAALPLNKAGFCCFSRDGARPCLYVTSAEDFKGYITTWNTKWKKVGSRKLANEPISALTISPDGKLLAIGSSEGEVFILSASKLSVLQRIKRAHMVFVTALDFSPDNRALLSVSGDSSARVTPCQTPQGWRTVVILWIILIALLLALILSRRGSLEFFPSASTHSSEHDMI